VTDVPSLSPASAVTIALPDSDPMIANVVLVDPIAAPADSVAALPATTEVTLYVQQDVGKPTISGTPSFSVTAISAGGVVFDLSDGYTLSVDELNAVVTVANSLTNESVKVWGAGQLGLDGADTARFWGTTSLTLSNGTKITLQTVPDLTAADLYWLDKLTVTRDEYAMVISGVSDQVLGDVAVDQSLDGYDVDDQTRDGLTLVTDGSGAWADELGHAVTQTVLDATAPGAIYGPDSTALSWGEVGTLFSRYLGFGQIVSLSQGVGRNLVSDGGRVDRSGSEAAARHAELQRAIALHAGVTRFPVA
jgi:hypothetical protein